MCDAPLEFDPELSVCTIPPTITVSYPPGATTTVLTLTAAQIELQYWNGSASQLDTQDFAALVSSSACWRSRTRH